MADQSDNKEKKIIFRPKKRAKCLRIKRSSSDSEEDKNEEDMSTSKMSNKRPAENNTDENPSKRIRTEDAVICSICKEPDSTEPFTSLICAHTFHTNCISPWLLRSRRCPICRTVVRENSESISHGNFDTDSSENYFSDATHWSWSDSENQSDIWSDMDSSGTESSSSSSLATLTSSSSSSSLATLPSSSSSSSEVNQIDSDSEPDLCTLLEDAKELRKIRRRQNGVSAIGLALGKKLSTQEELVAEDPFKLKTGGFIDMKVLKGKGKLGGDELDAVNLGSVFSAETNRRDEDADMMKYIEEELSKRKGTMGIPPSKKEALVQADSSSAHESEESVGSEGPLKADDVLFEVPEHLRKSTTKKSEEMLSNQMLSGIPEVDLGIEERIRNIEATEEAKLKVLRERMIKKDKSISFVPTNMAVNFVQHNRFNIDEAEQLNVKKRKESVQAKTSPIPVPTGTKPSKGKGEDDEKATDDFHFEKFKKQFRRF